MNDKAREPSEDSGASPAAQRRAAQQEEIRAAAEADRKRALKAHVKQNDGARQGYDDPAGFSVGLLALLLFLAACWLIIDKMRCDPFYSTVVRLPFHSCQ